MPGLTKTRSEEEWTLRLDTVILIVILAALGTGAIGAPPAGPTMREMTWTVTAVTCPSGDGVCLSYHDGAVPGPTLDVNLGDVVVLHVVNDIPRTLAALGPGPEDAWLSDASVSFHVHGTALAADKDGIDAHAGTAIVASIARPSESFTYRFRAVFPGTWHYHDHVLGPDGDEGARRGLFGTLIVRSGAEPRADHVLDLHMLDAGANAGAPVQGAPIAAGASFEVAVVGLGNQVWRVELEDPNGGLVGTTTVGPGMSSRLRVDVAQPGTYTWVAIGEPVPEFHTGTVVVS